MSRQGQRQTDRQRQTDGQTDRQTDRWDRQPTYIPSYLCPDIPEYLHAWTHVVMTSGDSCDNRCRLQPIHCRSADAAALAAAALAALSLAAAAGQLLFNSFAHPGLRNPRQWQYTECIRHAAIMKNLNLPSNHCDPIPAWHLMLDSPSKIRNRA